MIISRILAKRRIAAGERPSWRAAWLPVAADIVLIGIVLWIVWQLALMAIFLVEFALPATILFLMVVIYLPLQVVIVISTIWAVRSRWDDTPKD